MPVLSYLFFFNDTATTEIYTLSLHDALPISSSTSVPRGSSRRWSDQGSHERVVPRRPSRTRDTSVVAARAGGGRRSDSAAAPSRWHSADTGDPAGGAGRPPQ